MFSVVIILVIYSLWVKSRPR